MSHFYRHENKHEAAPRVHSPKRNPCQTPSRMARDLPLGSEYSPSKMRAHPDRKHASNHDSDKSLLEMLSSTVACLKQKNMDLEALGCLEQSLWLKRRMFGVDNSVVHKTLNEVVLSYNSVAMQYLAQGQFDQCLAMLRKAEAITTPGNFKRCQALQILTFNNIGCCYRKLGKLKSALKYLKEAAQIGSGSAHVKNLSITHLNLCAIQSQLGRHDLALEHAQAAIFHTQEELVSIEDGSTDERDEDSERDNDTREQSALVDSLDPKNREEKIISLAVAYHNLAVELEFNGRGEASLQWYKKALQLVWKYRDTNEALCESFKKIFLDAKKKQRTANIRQNGIPAPPCAANNTNKRRPVARPKSAHAASGVGNEAERGDLSYSSTVASHCYKATKPSTAGLRYGSPRSAAAGARNGKFQRPASATTRQRPVSAKRVNYRNSGSRDSAEDSFEQHWQKLEREHALTDFQAAPTGTKSARRPQSACSATAAARRRNLTAVETRQQKLQGQLYFAAHDVDIVGNDEDFGVILDDGDSDNGLDKYPETVSDCSNSQQDKAIENGAAPKFQRPARKQLSREPGMQQYRRVLDDSRSQAFNVKSDANEDNESVALSSQGPEVHSPHESVTGYSGDDDTDPDLPAQRVCHMEYLRRMKKLAESINDDLNGVGIRAPTVKSIELAANHSESPTLNREADPTNNESSSRVSTPRSATSKLRDRIQQARRDSWDNLHDLSSEKTNQVQAAIPVKSKQKVEDDGIELHEEVNVFDSEAEVCSAEQQLFHTAAGCRLQAFFRGQRCREEVKKLKQVKRENDSVNMIQRQVRLYVETLKEERKQEEERLQLELQKEEVEDMAACLIQRLCRRTLNRKRASMAGSNEEVEDGVEKAPVSQHRPFSIADVVLGVAVNKSQLNQSGRHELPHLNPAATISHINVNHHPEPTTPRRSSTISSIPLAHLDGVDSSVKMQAETTQRSDVYDDDEEWKSPPLDSSNSTPRTGNLLVSQPQCSTLQTSRSTREESTIQHQHIAAIIIQASLKGFVVRQRMAQGNAGDLTRLYIERKHFDVAMDHALALEQEFLGELSAIKIQALVRGRQSRLLIECIRAGVHSAASTIQQSFRSHRRNTRRAVDEGVRSIAAITIQEVYRGYEARRAAIHQAAVDEERLSVQQIAAITIQNVWREYFAVRDHSFEEIEAATCIQALGRGHLTRKSLKSLHGSSSSGLSQHLSAFSMSSSSVERLVEEDNMDSEHEAESLSINYSFLPASIRELYMSSSGGQFPSTNNQIHAQEIAKLGLTFEDFLRELETCTDVVVGSSALDAMRIMVETSPEVTKTLANVVKVARALDRRLQEGFWNDAIEASSIALLHAFRDVLDAP